MRKLLLFIIISLSFNLSAYGQSGVAANSTYSNTGCRIVSFKDATYTTSNYNPVKWKWYFTDGGSCNVQNSLHHFADAGTYNVALYITDTSGCSNSVIHPIQVEQPP